jgi:hypothetical protein
MVPGAAALVNNNEVPASQQAGEQLAHLFLITG